MVSPCFGDDTQGGGGGVVIPVGAEIRIVLCVEINHLDDVLFATGFKRLRNQPLDINPIGLDRKVSH